MEKHYFNPANLHEPRGYTHAVAVEGGRTIFIAGQVAFDHAGNLVGPGDLRVQAAQALENRPPRYPRRARRQPTW